MHKNHKHTLWDSWQYKTWTVLMFWTHTVWLISNEPNQVQRQSGLSTQYEGVWGSGGITPYILKHGTRWRWVVSSSPCLLYPPGKSHRYPMNRRLRGHQGQSEHWRKNTCPCHELNHNPLVTQAAACSEYWLSYPGSLNQIRTYKFRS